MIKGLFVGISTVDIQFYFNEYPQSNTKNKALSTRVDIGGPATNAAITFALLGGQATLVTIIGKHEFRRFMLNKLNAKKIKVIDLIDKVHCNPNFSAIISNFKNGERTVLASKASDIKLKMSEQIPDDFDICLIDGFLNEVATEITSSAERSGKIVVLDGGSWKAGMEEYLKHVGYAVCSSDFFPPDCGTSNEVISFLLDEGIGNIAITRGEKPIVVVENGRKTEIQIDKVDALDTLGAGDVFHGAFCYYLLRESNFVNALKKASMVATESCKYQGTLKWSLNWSI
jgi:sugar/nucleoside kinase (ribokinase family)